MQQRKQKVVLCIQKLLSKDKFIFFNCLIRARLYFKN
jgi:hypothetical protein